MVLRFELEDDIDRFGGTLMDLELPHWTFKDESLVPFSTPSNSLAFV